MEAVEERTLDAQRLKGMLEVTQKKSDTCFICRAIDNGYRQDGNEPRDIKVGGTVMSPSSQVYHADCHC